MQEGLWQGHPLPLSPAAPLKGGTWRQLSLEVGRGPDPDEKEDPQLHFLATEASRGFHPEAACLHHPCPPGLPVQRVPSGEGSPLQVAAPAASLLLARWLPSALEDGSVIRSTNTRLSPFHMEGVPATGRKPASNVTPLKTAVRYARTLPFIPTGRDSFMFVPVKESRAPKVAPKM